MIINELPLEEYLYSVVPSEMPWSYNYEALKAQAICARSFAYKHVMNNSYSEYGAHVDDSTSFQVYNNSEEQTVSNAAVDETYGQVLMHGSDIISAYFYSTSSGATTTSTVWGSEYPYTHSVVLNVENQNLNLTNETIFDSFIRTNYKTYDSEYPWYRWKVTFDLSQLTKSINDQIGTMKAENVQILNDKGNWVNKTIANVGHAESALLPTIRSRCRIVRMQPWTSARIEKALLAQNIPADRARALSRYCEGSLGRALSMQEDEHYWQARDLIRRSFLSIRRSADIPAAAALLKDQKDNCDQLLDILEQQIRGLIHQKMTGDEAADDVPDPFYQASPGSLRKILEAILQARRHKNANVGWAALAEGLMQTISEESSTWQA